MLTGGTNGTPGQGTSKELPYEGTVVLGGGVGGRGLLDLLFVETVEEVVEVLGRVLRLPVDEVSRPGQGQDV